MSRNEDGINEARGGALSTRDHLTLLAHKRDHLHEVIVDALDAVILQISRAEWTPREAVEWWQWARSIKVPYASSRVITALGLPINTLKQWEKVPPGEWLNLCGDFPVNSQITPPKGRPCVYLLLDEEHRCIYVGLSSSVRNRIKTHWRDQRIPAASWEIITCTSATEAAQLEADLIYHHQPSFNINGRHHRGNKFSPRRVS